ncbi:hypothetical protein ABPG75_011460 [Micractinium tetrahymenae]
MSVHSQASWSEVSGLPGLPPGIANRAALDECRRGNFGPAVSVLLAAAFRPEHEAQERLLQERRAAAEAAAHRLQALAERYAAPEAAAAAEGCKVQALCEEHASLEDQCATATARLVAARAVGAVLEAEGASQRSKLSALAAAEQALRRGLDDLRGRQAQLELGCGLLQDEVEAAERRRACLLEEAAEAEAQFKRWQARLASVTADLSTTEGQLRTKVAELEARVAELAPALEQCTAQLGESQAQAAESQAQMAALERELQLHGAAKQAAEARAQEAEARARKAEARAQEAEARARKAEADHVRRVEAKERAAAAARMHKIEHIASGWALPATPSARLSSGAHSSGRQTTRPVGSAGSTSSPSVGHKGSVAWGSTEPVPSWPPVSVGWAPRKL